MPSLKVLDQGGGPQKRGTPDTPGDSWIRGVEGGAGD